MNGIDIKSDQFVSRYQKKWVLKELQMIWYDVFRLKNTIVADDLFTITNTGIYHHMNDA